MRYFSLIYDWFIFLPEQVYKVFAILQVAFEKMKSASNCLNLRELVLQILPTSARHVHQTNLR